MSIKTHLYKKVEQSKPANNPNTTAVAKQAKTNAGISVFKDADSFATGQRMATALSASSFVPDAFCNNLPNCLIALEMSHRMGASVMAVMQNMYIVKGKPAWSATYIIAAINQSGRFKTTLMYDVKKDQNGNTIACSAYAYDKFDNKIEGPVVDENMVQREGWISNKKWTSMPDVMYRYRAASFFGKMYAPDILMGMQTVEELEDVYDVQVTDTPAPEEATDVTPEPENAAEPETPKADQPQQEAKPEQEFPVEIEVVPVEQPAHEEFPNPKTIDDLDFILKSKDLTMELKQTATSGDWFAGIKVAQNHTHSAMLAELGFVFSMGRYVKNVTDLVRNSQKMSA